MNPTKCSQGWADNLCFVLFFLFKSIRAWGMWGWADKDLHPLRLHHMSATLKWGGIKEPANPWPDTMPSHVVHGAYISKLLFFCFFVIWTSVLSSFWHVRMWLTVTNCTLNGLCVDCLLCQRLVWWFLCDLSSGVSLPVSPTLLPRHLQLWLSNSQIIRKLFIFKNHLDYDCSELETL